MHNLHFEEKVKAPFLRRSIIPELENQVTHYDVTNRVTNSNWS